MKKSIVLLVALTFAATLGWAGTAMANYGPHGGYSKDTDACAGCHRAHTSFSSAQRTDYSQFSSGKIGSALLVGNSQNMREFCYACHGDGAPGAATNVASGVFDAGPSGAKGTAIGDGVTDSAGTTAAVAYVTDSSFGATLNGGGFSRMPAGAGAYKASTSMHDMDAPTTDPIWGAGNSVSSAQATANSAGLSCTDCHDPHGSSNYRLLKDFVNGTRVGGYLGDTPDPYVVSAEIGYPADGWEKHEAGANQVTGYEPNYTSTLYRQTPSSPAERNMSVWCAACHQSYAESSGSFSAPTGTDPAGVFSSTGLYSYGAFENGVGAKARHRHPVNMNLATESKAEGIRSLASAVVTDAVLPLEMKANKNVNAFRGTTDFDDYVGCLTCHRAHGTAADMSGWAEASLETTGSGASQTWYPVRLSQPVTSGVNPNFSSALLRTDNRGVCERCHNK